nr:MAG TPA: hypothetical protein [Caudoviricetes sp.]
MSIPSSSVLPICVLPLFLRAPTLVGTVCPL